MNENTRSVEHRTKYRPPGARAPLSWLLSAPPASKKALLAASLGWMLDSFDIMLYSLVLARLLVDLHMTKQTGGILGSLTLIAAAIGGLLFGVIADRFGRTRALMASVLLYAVFTAACGLSQTVWQLALCRLLLGLGMGGEWASGASLVAETWPAEHRGKALGLMQSSWAIGYALAALVSAVILPRFGWRAVFFAGLAPALLTLWIRKGVKEPQAWQDQARNSKLMARSSSDMQEQVRPDAGRAVLRTVLDRFAVKDQQPTFSSLFRRPLLSLTLALTAMNACCLFAWWGFNLWIPAYLSLSPTKGGIGLTSTQMTAIIVFMQAGMWLGYITFGIIADRLGRKRVYIAYLLAAAALLAAFSRLHSAWALFALAPFVAFTATGYFTGFAAVTAEIYPTAIRSTAQGLTYNTGRIASAAAPFLVGSLADRHGFSSAFLVSAAAFLLAAALWRFIPETLTRQAGPHPTV